MQNYKNCIQLSLTLTKLCHIKRYHLVNFDTSLEKHEKCDISATVQPISTKFNVITQNVSDWLLKISISKFQGDVQPPLKSTLNMV